ncbi:hypothetical protein HFD88_003837 [Aspergillus terreus]|nr:hypothetical protein HFD88_003837 [Aspergillus terreus]
MLSSYETNSYIAVSCTKAPPPTRERGCRSPHSVPPAAPELTPAQSARRVELRMELDRRRPELREIKQQKKELQQRLEEVNALLEARVYKELNLDIELDEPGPAAAEQTQEVKDQRANLKAEKRALKAQILALEERKRRKSKKNKKPAAAAPAPPPAPAPAEPAFPKEEFERIYHLAREQVYKKLHLDIELDELAPGQRLYRDELLGRLQAVKGQKATFKAEKKAIREQIGALEQRIEWIDSALKG